MKCNNNNIDKIHKINNLEYLFCNKNKLKELPSFPNLKVLECKENYLISLPKYPNLLAINCYSNQIINLYNELNNNIETIICCNNNISEITNISQFVKLKVLNISYNTIHKIPDDIIYLQNLEDLRCIECDLLFLPKLSYLPKLKKLLFYRNYNLRKKIHYFFVKNKISYYVKPLRELDIIINIDSILNQIEKNINCKELRG